MTQLDDLTNPYRSPGQSSSKVPLSDYYVLNSTKLGFGELWALSSSWFQFLALCLFKLFRHRVPSIVATRIPENAIELEVDTVRKELQGELDCQFAKLDGTGLEHLCYFQSPVVGQTEQVAKIGFSPQQSTIVSVQHLRVYTGGQRHTIQRFVFQSPLDGGGRYLWTIAGRHGLRHSSDCEAEHFPVRSVHAAWRRHQERVASAQSGTQVTDGEAAKRYLLEWWRNEFQHHVERGLYEQADVDRLQEIRKLQEKFEEHWPEYRRPDRLVSTLYLLFMCMFLVAALTNVFVRVQVWSFHLQWIALLGILGTYGFAVIRKRVRRNHRSR